MASLASTATSARCGQRGVTNAQDLRPYFTSSPIWGWVEDAHWQRSQRPASTLTSGDLLVHRRAYSAEFATDGRKAAHARRLPLVALDGTRRA